MTEKELKKLSRKQLLVLLLAQTKRADELQEQLDEARRELEDKSIDAAEAGSIAEAALRLNGVFESAEAAASQYVEAVKRLREKQYFLNRRSEAESKRKADAMIAEAEKRCAEREAAAEKRLQAVASKFHKMYEQKRQLDELLTEYSVKQSNAG